MPFNWKRTLRRSINAPAAQAAAFLATPYFAHFAEFFILGFPSLLDIDGSPVYLLLPYLITGAVDYGVITIGSFCIPVITPAHQDLVENGMRLASFIFRSWVLGFDVIAKEIREVNLLCWEEVRRLNMLLLWLNPALFWHAMFGLLQMLFRSDEKRAWIMALYWTLATGSLSFAQSVSGFRIGNNTTEKATKSQNRTWAGTFKDALKTTAIEAPIEVFVKYLPTMALALVVWLYQNGPLVTRNLNQALDLMKSTEVISGINRIDEAFAQKRDWFVRLVYQWMIDAYHIFTCIIWRTTRVSSPDISARRIRLLKVYPSYLTDDGTIHCALDWYNLDNAPRYTGISYTWGNPTPACTITVNKMTRKIPKSAFEVIRGRRSRWRTKLLWIDALCIDQDSPVDKAEQIPLMASIYNNASSVDIWLGSSPFAAYATSLIRRLRIRSILSKEMDGFQNALDSPEIAWRALRDMLQHPWFERTWIVQEVVFSKSATIWYGDSSVGWDTFTWFTQNVANEPSTMKKLGLMKNSPILAMQNITTIEEVRSLHNIKAVEAPGLIPADAKADPQALSLLFTLIRLFRARSQFTATLIKDRVYALLTLCNQESNSNFRANYVQSDGKLFTDVVRHHICTATPDHQLDFLAHAGRGHGRSTADLPSWAPDWSINPETEPLFGFSGISELLSHPRLARLLHVTALRLSYGEHDFDERPMYNAAVKSLKDTVEAVKKVIYHASSEKTPHASIYNNKILSLQGHLVDRVKAVGPVYHTPMESNTTETPDYILLSWAQMILRAVSRQYPDRDTILDAFCRTIVGDLTKSWQGFTDLISPHRPASADTVALVKQYIFLQTIVNAPGENEKTLYAKLKPALQEITQLLQSTCTGRVIGITEKGFIGLFLHGTRNGDYVWVIDGFGLPVVTRVVGGEYANVTEGYKEFSELIGAAYVHDIMNGEAVKGQKAILLLQ